MIDKKVSRRSALSRLFIALGGLLATGKVGAATATPKATEGPFYPRPSMRFDDIDNDLVKVEGKVKEAGGEILHLSGTVMKKDGEPYTNARIEIWQCDVNGKYLHPGDSRDIAYDTGFQGFGHDITNDKGRYSFRTIVPTRYPGRTPHIHAKVLIDGKEQLTTQFYVSDLAENNDDFLYRRMSKEQAASVSMKIVNASDKLETTVDVVV